MEAKFDNLLRAVERSECCKISAGRMPALLGLFDHGFGADYDHDAVFGYGVAGAVGFEVVADDRAFGKLDVAIDDAAADAAVAADGDVVEDDGLVDFAETVDAH